MTYEKAIERLTQIVDLLSNEGANLNEATKLFEEGLGLIKFCYEQVKVTKGKIFEIKEELGKLKMEEMQ